MKLLEILCLWVMTTAPGIAALQVPPSHPHSLLLARLDRLESLMADRQAQFQHERDEWEKEKQILQHERLQWEKEKQILAESLHLLQGDVHALQKEKQEMRREMEALHNTQTLTQTFAAENQGLKAQLGDIQRQLDSMNSKQRSLQDQVTRCEGNPRPDTAGDEELGEEDERSPGEQSGQADHTAELQRDSQQVKDPSSRHQKDSNPIQHVSNPDPFKQHVWVARSDDQGPMEVVVNHLAQQTTQLAADVQALRAFDARQQQDIQAARGSTFVHWGSSTCAGSAELVYSGMVGVSWWDHSGAAANALCLSLSPTLVNMSRRWKTVLYGAEYETDDTHQNMDPVCAVCQSLHPTTIMVPGTNVCSAGWSLQFSGFLMAGDESGKAATEFICVDSKLEGAIHSNDNHNGYLLYYTYAQCGSLPCPPYQNNSGDLCCLFQVNMETNICAKMMLRFITGK